MKKPNRSTLYTLVSLTVALMLTALVGCSRQSTDPIQTNPEELNLTDLYGGYRATDEAPAFGDSEILSLEGGSDANDPLRGTAEMDSLIRHFSRDIYAVQFLWGHLEPDSTETVITDWSGLIFSDRGAVMAVRLISFERGDYIVRPRTSRQVLEFVSYTREAFDGILIYLYDPNPDSFDTENTLTFATDPYTRRFTTSELSGLRETVDVGNLQVQISALKLSQIECAEGFFEGRWIRQGRDGLRGNFFGRWISHDGLLLGHVRGHFGTRVDGSQVLFGKWISPAGQFRGLLRGEWGYDEDDGVVILHRGWLKGGFADSRGLQIGEFSGAWVARVPTTGPRDEEFEPGDFGQGRGDGRHAGRGVGGFRGAWSQLCDD